MRWVRMTEILGKPRKIILDCEHILWLRSPLPSPGDELYCRPCGAYQTVGPTRTHGKAYELSEWSWQQQGGVFVAYCEAGDCQETREHRNWYALRDVMDSHHIRVHSHSSLIFGIPKAIPKLNLRRNAPPPF